MGVISTFMDMVLDTNILLLHLREGILNAAPLGARFYISVISEAEILRYPGISEDDLKAVDDLLSIMTIVTVDSSLARHAAMLGRTFPAKLPDLFIAATALKLGLPLITKDLRGFHNIPGLEVRDIL